MTPVLSKMIPIFAMTYCATVLLSLIALYDVHLQEFLKNTILDEDSVVRSVRYLAQFCQDIVDVIWIVSITWFVKNIKNRAIFYIINKHLSQFGLRRMLMAGSFVFNYLLYIGAFLAGLDAFGFDISPLLASLGASSVLIGIASREILENVAATITLYTSPPFSIGDVIKMYSVEGLDAVQVVAEGTVQSINPLNTVIKTSTGSLVYVANSMVIKWMVENLSQS
jgi:MscS family membrane protein